MEMNKRSGRMNSWDVNLSKRFPCINDPTAACRLNKIFMLRVQTLDGAESGGVFFDSDTDEALLDLNPIKPFKKRLL